MVGICLLSGQSCTIKEENKETAGIQVTLKALPAIIAAIATGKNTNWHDIHRTKRFTWAHDVLRRPNDWHQRAPRSQR